MLIEKITLNNKEFIYLDTVENKEMFVAAGLDIKEVETTEGIRLDETKAIREKKMNTDYNGTSISLTSEDQAGLLAVKAGLELGMERTVFRFENGTKMELTPENFSAVATFFVSERNKFFQE